MAEHIQIGDVVPRIQYVANGVQTTFTYPFPIFAADDVEAYLGAARQSSGFTVSGAGLSAGGSLSFAVPPGNGVIVTLRRRLGIQRVTDHQADGVIRAKVINDELDYQTAAIQQVAEDADRAVKRAATSVSTADLTLPEPDAGKALKWNDSGTGLVNSRDDADQVTAAASLQANTAIASANAAAGSAASARSAAADAATSAGSAAGAASQAQTYAGQAQAAANGAVRVSAGDTVASYLSAGLTAGANVSLSIVNPGGDESLKIAVTGLGTASALASDADTTLAANSDARLPTQKAVKAYVAANGAPQSLYDRLAYLEWNLGVSVLRQVVEAGWSVQKMVAGIADEFVDQTGIASLGGATYDASNKAVANPIIATTANSGSAGWSGSGNFNFSASDISQTSYACCLERTAADLTGDFDFTYTQVNQTGSGASYGPAFQFGIVTATAGYPAGGNSYVGANFTPAWVIGYNGVGSNQTVGLYHGSIAVATATRTIAAGDTFTVRRRGTTLTALHNGVTIGTFTGFNSSAAVYQAIAHGSGSNETVTWGAVNWALLSPGGVNVTVVSTATAAVAQPVEMRAVLLHEPVDTVTLNTDVVFEVSRDGGTTWSTATLANQGPFDAVTFIRSAAIDVSGQPAGSSVKWRVRTLNAKSQRFHGVWLQWRT
jgi:hypothetical protein